MDTEKKSTVQNKSKVESAEQFLSNRSYKKSELVAARKRSTKDLIELTLKNSVSGKDRETAIYILLGRLGPRKLEKLKIIKPEIANSIINDEIKKIKQEIKIYTKVFSGPGVYFLIIIGLAALSFFMASYYSKNLGLIIIVLDVWLALMFYFKKGPSKLMKGFMILYLYLELLWKNKKLS